MRSRIFANNIRPRAQRSQNVAARKDDYLVFDFEALGLKVHTDQPIQGGFVKLDENFDITDRVNISIRRNKYSIPGPKALEVTGVSPEDLDNEDRTTEFEAANVIGTILGGQRGNGKRIFTGYNTLSYDEQLLRYFFFRNFQYPYITSGSSSRKLDLFQAVRLLSFLRPGLIKPGHDTEGKVSWKLEVVIEANGIEKGQSHDALGDSIMTAGLLHRFHDHAPDVLTSLVEMSNQKRVSGWLKNMISADDHLYLFTYYEGPEMHPIIPVLETASKGILCIDLSKDPEAWVNSTPEELLEAGGAFGKDVPFKVVRPNSCPYLFASDDPLIATKVQEQELSPEELSKRIEFMKTPQIKEKMAAFARLMDKEREDKFSEAPLTDEQTLYGGAFPDKFVSRAFCAAENWEKRVSLVENMTDKRLRAFGNRLIAMHAPSELQTSESLEVMRKEIIMRLEGGPELFGAVTTMAEAREQLDTVNDVSVREQCAQYLDALELRLQQEIRDIDQRIFPDDDACDPGTQLSLF